jgi:GNAT superfamily N-acetyltransferase
MSIESVSPAVRRGPGPLPEGFADLPHLVFAADPDWIPEEPEQLAVRFSSANPWFDRGEAATWCLPGRGRIAAFHHPEARTDGSRDVFFGLWCSNGDLAVDRALLDAVRGWSREHEAARLVGPVDFSSLGLYRVRLGARDGIGTFPGEPHSHPGAAERLRELGFGSLHQYDSRIMEGPTLATMRASLEADRVVAMTAGYTLRALDLEAWDTCRDGLLHIVEQSFGANYGYVPVDRAALGQLVAGLSRTACPQTSMVAIAPDGAVAGVLMTVPHWGPIVSQGAGAARVPLSSLAYDRHWPSLVGAVGRPWLVYKTAAVLSEHRRHGVFSLLAAGAADTAADRYRGFIWALSRLDTHIQDIYRKSSVPGWRRYALYEQAL